MESASTSPAKASSLRWGILRQALLHRHSANPDCQSQIGIERISRKTAHGFNLIPCRLRDAHVEGDSDSLLKINSLDVSREACVCYTLPLDGAPKLVLFKRIDNCVDLSDFKICNRYDIDNTGLVCHWPSEDVLSYFCLSNADMFRSKKVIELGSGYGLAGLVIAASTYASEVVISDGNPQVVNYIQRNIDANSGAFADTIVKSMTLHWNQEEISEFSNTFDIVVASDCTFFKESHEGLARTVKSLLKRSQASEAIFFGPKRGDSLDKFLERIKKLGLNYRIEEQYNEEVWKCHQRFLNVDGSWPNYEKDHCYPLLVKITF